MTFDISPISENGDIRFCAYSDDKKTVYGTLKGRYSPNSKEMIINEFDVPEEYKGRKIEIALYTALKVLAEKQLRLPLIAVLGPEIPDDLKKQINDLLKKAKFMH